MGLMKVIKRVEMLKSLNTMIFGIINSFAPLLWAFMILLIVMYAFGILFLSVTSNWIEGQHPGTEEVQVYTLENYFGSMYQTICTLFESFTGGVNWNEAAVSLG